MPDPLRRFPTPLAPLSPMPAPEGLALSPPTPSNPPSAAGRAPGAAEGRSFHAILVDVASGIDAHERAVDAALDRARRGAGLSPPELIAVQAGVYRYAHELELATKVVDKASNALRQTLESQR